ncbi:hypothetical protein ISS07_01900 [Candidatus Woesearchaeota archaeon]|nr:hypothetical protein [Candidatus Woesearchaeota archaeon]
MIREQVLRQSFGGVDGLVSSRGAIYGANLIYEGDSVDVLGRGHGSPRINSLNGNNVMYPSLMVISGLFEPIKLGNSPATGNDFEGIAKAVIDATQEGAVKPHPYNGSEAIDFSYEGQLACVKILLEREQRKEEFFAVLDQLREQGFDYNLFRTN